MISAKPTEGFFNDLLEFFENLLASCPDPDDKCGFLRYEMEECGGGKLCNTECTFKVATRRAEGWKCLSEGCCGTGYMAFQEGELDTNPGDRKLISIVEDAKGSMGTTASDYYKEIPRVLPLRECEDLLGYSEAVFQRVVKDPNGTDGIRWKTQTNITEDFRFEVPPRDLEAFLSQESLERLYKVFADFTGPSDPKIVIRRTAIQGNKHIPYHNDGEFAVMHAFLNGDELDGGNLHYLTPHGAVETDASTGTVLLHKNGIVHGVSSFYGVRVILLLLAKTSALKTEL